MGRIMITNHRQNRIINRTELYKSHTVYKNALHIIIVFYFLLHFKGSCSTSHHFLCAHFSILNWHSKSSSHIKGQVILQLNSGQFSLRHLAVSGVYLPFCLGVWCVCWMCAVYAHTSMCLPVSMCTEFLYAHSQMDCPLCHCLPYSIEKGCSWARATLEASHA
jgi:hypothetical protein